MSKHTSGPWCLVADEVYSTPDMTDLIAEVTGGSGTRYIDNDCNAECLANAKLIAAAPELLDALKECFSEPGAYAFASEDFYKAKQRLLAINNIVRDAVMKATGETIK